MPIDWNGLVKAAENDLTRALASRVVSGLVSQFSWLSAVSGPLGFLVGILIGQLVKYGDWLVYALGDNWKNTEEGKAYEEASLKNASAPKDSPDKAALEAAQKAAFDRLMGVP